MSKEIVSQGESFLVVLEDRTYGGVMNKVCLHIDGTSGKLQTGGTVTPGVYGATAATPSYTGGSTVLSGASLFGAVAAGHSGVGAITVAGALVGDAVVMVTNMTTPALATSSFESTVSVAGQVQQTSASNLSASTFSFLLAHQ
jgi:hypothetical protein